MDLRPCSLLLLWTLLVALVLLAQEVLAQRIYTNTWAVLVPAGPQEADRLARKHGFLNLGPVSPSLPPPHRSSVPAGSAAVWAGAGLSPTAGGWLCLGGRAPVFVLVHCSRLAPTVVVVAGWGRSLPISDTAWWHGTAGSACWRWKEEKPISGRGSWESCALMEEGRAPGASPSSCPCSPWRAVPERGAASCFSGA